MDPSREPPLKTQKADLIRILGLILGGPEEPHFYWLDSKSILFNRSFQKFAVFFFWGFSFLKRRIPGKNGWKVPLDFFSSNLHGFGLVRTASCTRRSKGSLAQSEGVACTCWCPTRFKIDAGRPPQHGSTRYPQCQFYRFFFG